MNTSMPAFKIVTALLIIAIVSSKMPLMAHATQGASVTAVCYSDLNGNGICDPGEAVPYACLVLFSGKGGVYASNRSDSTGVCTIGGLELGSYILCIAGRPKSEGAIIAVEACAYGGELVAQCSEKASNGCIYLEQESGSGILSDIEVQIWHDGRAQEAVPIEGAVFELLWLSGKHWASYEPKRFAESSQSGRAIFESCEPGVYHIAYRGAEEYVFTEYPDGVYAVIETSGERAYVTYSNTLSFRKSTNKAYVAALPKAGGIEPGNLETLLVFCEVESYFGADGPDTAIDFSLSVKAGSGKETLYDFRLYNGQAKEFRLQRGSSYALRAGSVDYAVSGSDLSGTLVESAYIYAVAKAYSEYQKTTMPYHMAIEDSMLVYPWLSFAGCTAIALKRLKKKK
ncbi:MAG: hypothetical protein FWG30_11930 [Eubacteriaceae bacterium]|nr:hypothetical protein [Eubacteriaceae bacterium]